MVDYFNEHFDETDYTIPKDLSKRILSDEEINALLEVVEEDDLKAKKEKTLLTPHNIIRRLYDIFKNMCGAGDINYYRIDEKIHKYNCYYALKIKKVEILVSIELMNAMMDYMLAGTPKPDNTIDDNSIDGAKVIFDNLLKELGIENDTYPQIKIKSDYNLKGKNTYYKVDIDIPIDGIICINEKKKYKIGKG